MSMVQKNEAIYSSKNQKMTVGEIVIFCGENALGKFCHGKCFRHPLPALFA